MAIYVTKADGTRQTFDKEKVVRTCLKMGASREIAYEIAERIETKLYEGIETNIILKNIFKLLGKHKPTVKHLIDLRRALALMRSKPDFEHFIRIVLSEHGYEVEPNQIVRGKCVEHEVDAIARKNNETYLVEVKHHRNFHTPTGLDESRIARAVLEDLVEGYELGFNNFKIDQAMIVCNTKFSGHAKRYGKCRGLLQIGWSQPPYRSLQDMIEEKKLRPLTCLKGLSRSTVNKLTTSGIILLKQLSEESPEKLVRATGISRETIKLVVEKAKSCTL